ncbi:MAG: hypothetical protein ABFD44_06170, partial [Anaerolineaceae bacterium]
MSNIYSTIYDEGGWVNSTVRDFLESSLRWVEDKEKANLGGLPDQPTWKAFAEFLYVGKIYE